VHRYKPFDQQDLTSGGGEGNSQGKSRFNITEVSKNDLRPFQRVLPRQKHEATLLSLMTSQATGVHSRLSGENCFAFCWIPGNRIRSQHLIGQPSLSEHIWLLSVHPDHVADSRGRGNMTEQQILLERMNLIEPGQEEHSERYGTTECSQPVDVPERCVSDPHP